MICVISNKNRDDQLPYKLLLQQDMKLVNFIWLVQNKKGLES